jgi:hypothetical protein
VKKNYAKTDGNKLIKILLKNDPKSGTYKLLKCGVKNDQKTMLKIDPKLVLKISFIIDAMGGYKIILKSHFSTSGTRDPQFINFLKFRHFLQNRSIFRPPQTTPKRAPIENAIPHKNACTFAPMGGSKMSLFGGGGAGPVFAKKVDTTI